MSGGVDSAVAAALLKEQGHDAVGVTLRLYDEQRPADRAARGCCGSGAVRDARRVAARLGIRHYAWDFRQAFEEQVVADFCREYGRGRTPNPCLRCNRVIKFGRLFERLPALEAGVLATGHHARIAEGEDGRWRLLRGRDAAKDQSYFLYELTQAQMAQVLMPVGELTKTEVRERARGLGLGVAEKPESQDVCFVPDGDCAGFLRGRHPEFFRPGQVLDTQGRILGEHEGIAAFTVGQRKGLGLALGERMYVVRLDPERNVVVLGREEEAAVRTVEAGAVTWVAGAAPELPVRILAKVRSQGPGGAALVESAGADRVRVAFDEPQWAPALGQAVVFWQDDEVLGGGTIEQSWTE
ncbi:tRNA 2-thiouridine(34) synthase MnmA [candidate division WOR-3 bacterium]|nr:tRNA 2-thiouridine(34) synthase MnmA [candidate division WOR-3 bacterium]